MLIRGILGMYYWKHFIGYNNLSKRVCANKRSCIIVIGYAYLWFVLKVGITVIAANDNTEKKINQELSSAVVFIYNSFNGKKRIFFCYVIIKTPNSSLSRNMTRTQVCIMSTSGLHFLTTLPISPCSPCKLIRLHKLWSYCIALSIY